MIISTASSEPLEAAPCIWKPLVVLDPESVWQKNISRKLQEGFSALDITCECVNTQSLLQRDHLKDLFCFSLLETEGSLLRDMDATRLKELQKIIARLSQLLWVTSPTRSIDEFDGGIHLGFARTVRSERGDLSFVTLELDSTHKSATEIALKILCVYFNTIPHLSNGTYERELVERQGRIDIPRYFWNAELNSRIAAISSEKPEVKTIETEKAPPFELISRTPGLLDSLHYQEIPDELDPPIKDEVDIEVVAAGLNFRDVLVALGKLDPIRLGLEGSGIVKRVG